MNANELIERLTDIVMLQAEIIKEQAETLEQMDAITAEEKRAVAESKLKIVGI